MKETTLLSFHWPASIPFTLSNFKRKPPLLVFLLVPSDITFWSNSFQFLRTVPQAWILQKSLKKNKQSWWNISVIAKYIATSKWVIYNSSRQNRVCNSSWSCWERFCIFMNKNVICISSLIGIKIISEVICCAVCRKKSTWNLLGLSLLYCRIGLYLDLDATPSLVICCSFIHEKIHIVGTPTQTFRQT